MKLNTVQKSTIPGEGPWYVATSQNETECPHFPSRKEARAAANALRAGQATVSGPTTAPTVLTQESQAATA
jgi:hypothetical protein